MNLNETISTTEKKPEEENFDRYSGSWINKTEALFTFKRFEESFLMHTKHKTQLFLALFLHLMIIAGFIYMWRILAENQIPSIGYKCNGFVYKIVYQESKCLPLS